MKDNETPYFKNELAFEKYLRKKIKQEIPNILLFPKLETHLVAVPDVVFFKTDIQQLFFLELKMEPIKKTLTFVRQIQNMQEIMKGAKNCHVCIVTPFNYVEILNIIKKSEDLSLLYKKFQKIYIKYMPIKYLYNKPI